MVKDKKSKISKMEKLRRILDNPFDPNNKNLISKEDKNLETIRRKLSGELSKNKNQLHLSEFGDIESSNLEPTIDVHEKKRKEIKTKQFEFTNKDSDEEDLIEIEKIEETKPKFVEIKSGEIIKKSEQEKDLEKKEKDEKETNEFIQIVEKKEPKFSPENINGEETPDIPRKVKIVDFKDIEEEEFYWKTKRGLLSSDKIQMYKPITIIEIWVFTIIISIVVISGLFLLRDWIFLNFSIYGDKFISTPSGIQNIHIWFGFIFAVLGIFHLIIHIFFRDKDILPKNTIQDFKSFLHSGLYLIGLSRREDFQTSGRFSGRQRIVYIALVYILGLATITGFLYYFNLFSENLALIHIIPAGLSIMVLLFHFLITIRNHDIVALRCAFIDGKIPRWYARKKSPIWFNEINKKREKIFKKLPLSTISTGNHNLIEGKNALNNALLKFAILLDENPDKEDIKEITNRLKTQVSPDELKRIIELAEELDDKPEEENKQKSKDEEQTIEQESKAIEESSDKN